MLALPSPRRVLVQYGRAVKASFLHDTDHRLAVMWRFALASVVCFVFAVIALFQSVFLSGPRMSGLLASLGFLVIAIGNGAYVTWVAWREGFTSDSPPPAPPD